MSGVKGAGVAVGGIARIGVPSGVGWPRRTVGVGLTGPSSVSGVSVTVVRVADGGEAPAGDGVPVPERGVPVPGPVGVPTTVTVPVRVGQGLLGTQVGTGEGMTIGAGATGLTGATDGSGGGAIRIGARAWVGVASRVGVTVGEPAGEAVSRGSAGAGWLVEAEKMAGGAVGVSLIAIPVASERTVRSTATAGEVAVGSTAKAPLKRAAATRLPIPSR